MLITTDVDVEVNLEDFDEKEIIEYLNECGYEVFKKLGGTTEEDLSALADAKIRNSPEFDRMFADYVYNKLGRVIP